MKIAAIITAAGFGSRMGMDKPKQYLDIAGKPIIVHTLNCFAEIQDISCLAVVVPPEDVKSFTQNIIKAFGFPVGWQVVAGGKVRQESVFNGLKSLPKDVDIVIIHDGVRPFIRRETVMESVEIARREGACMVGMPIKETIKRVDVSCMIDETVDRARLWGAQTPQTFQYKLICDAFASAERDGFVGTDDAMLVERLGKRVRAIESDYRNIKITTPEDLEIAEAIAQMQIRISKF